MAIPNNALVYCDANFFVAYGARQTKQPDLQRRAQILFANLLVNNCTIVASPLTFDEAWNGIRKEVGPKTVKNMLRHKINGLLGNIGIRLANCGVLEFSFNEVIFDLKNFTGKLLSSSKFQVIQFPTSREKDGVRQALDNLEKLKIKPRDSFHLSMMQLNSIQYFVTRDTGFSGRSGLNIISF